MVKAVLPEMEARNSGQIILFGSIAGTCPERNMSAYCASKAAVNMFAEILWKELDNTDIKVLLVCPAITNTPRGIGNGRTDQKDLYIRVI